MQHKPKPDLAMIKVSVPADLRVQMIKLRISPTAVARKAFEKEVERREKIGELASARRLDPRLKLGDLARPSRRTKRLVGL